MENLIHPSYTDHALLVPMNKGRSNDHDFVPPTQYKSSRTKQPRPSLLSQLELIPEFEAMELENAKGSSQNLDTIDSNQEDLDHRELDMAVLHVRFISVREELAGKSILSCQSLGIRIIVRNQAIGCCSRCRASSEGVEIVP